MKKRHAFLLLVALCSTMITRAQDSTLFRRISDEILMHGECYDNLKYLCKKIGNRLSGTTAADKAVQWAKDKFLEAGADTVWLQPVQVPVWHRGKESLSFQYPGAVNFQPVKTLSLGNAVGTNGKPLIAPVLLINTQEELWSLTREQAEGKIVFFNGHFNQKRINTFEAYGEIVNYRSHVPNIASSKGALGIIIRSVSTGLDDEPHTGAFHYADSAKAIPAMAIGNTTADMLAEQCKKGMVKAMMQSECAMKGTTLSHSVIAEIKGSELPEEIVLIGGHIDSWDVGEGAHDDGAGCVQSIEVIRTLKALNIRPKRTIRAVLFMNEENGLKGGFAYADTALAKKEKHIAAIESDAGGFSPRGFGLDMNTYQKNYIRHFASLFLPYGVYDFSLDESGADITPLHKTGVPALGLLPDPQRYFDLHHTHADVFEQVNHRELKMGAVALAQMAYLLSEHGLR